MQSEEYFQTLAALWDGQLVVCALGTNANEWWRLTRSPDCFYMHAAMGFSSSFALGLALALPRAEVWLLDSDGGLSMNLGGLLTEAAARPPNLKHLVLANRCYQTLRGAPLVNADVADYAGIARAAGIRNVWSSETAADLRDRVQAFTSSGEHAFVVAEVERVVESDQFEPPPPLPYEGPEVKYRFGRHIEQKLGVSVFGPQGF